MDRTELGLLALRRLREGGRIADVLVYVDSPMALAVTEAYRSAAPSRQRYAAWLA